MKDQKTEAATITASDAQGDIRQFFAADLEISTEKNARTVVLDEKTKMHPIDDDIKSLAALILSQGLLQNLVGFIILKKNKASKVQIIAGGRRLTAINYLIWEGKLPVDFPIAVKIVADKNSYMMSVTENVARKSMTPANEFKAYKKMRDEGRTADEIAAAFGVDEKYVKRRLVLACVEPSIFAEYEAGNASLELLKALTLTDDHATQLQVWNSLQGYQRNVSNIRRLLTTSVFEAGNDRVLKYVTLDAYKAAGGLVHEDLFDTDSALLKDPVLLESLAADKMKLESAVLQDEGWQWIEHHTRTNNVDISKYENAPTIQLKLTEEQEAERKLLEDALAEAEEKIEEHESNTGESESNHGDDEEGDQYDDEDDENDDEVATEDDPVYAALCATRDEIEGKLSDFDDAFTVIDPLAKPFAGALVTIGYGGKIEIRRGVLRPEDKKKYREVIVKEVKANPEIKESYTDSYGLSKITRADDGKKAEHSEKLTRQLTAHRTAALQFMLAQRPDIALVALTHRLILGVVSQRWGNQHASPLHIHLTVCSPANESDDVKNSLAANEFAGLRQKLFSLLPMPDHKQGLFNWLLEQDSAFVLELMALCTACSLDTIQTGDTIEPKNIQLAQALNLNMADYWEPTRDTYFAHIKKDKIVSLVTEVVSMDAGLSMAQLGKADLCDAAEKAMAGKHWLPALLKVPPKSEAVAEATEPTGSNEIETADE